MTIAILFNQFGPYHYARLNALGKISRLYGIEFFSKSNTYKWESSNLNYKPYFIKETLFNVDNPALISNEMLLKKIFEALDKIDPDVVAINGWSEAGAFAALKWCLLKKKPAIAMSESTELDENRSVIKEAVKKKIVNKFSSAIVGGRPHKRYIVKLGMPANYVFEKYDVIDNDYFMLAAKNVRANNLANRKRLGLPHKYFLASARFVNKKNLLRLVEAYSIYVLERKEEAWDLVILGDGELEPVVTALVKKLNLQEKTLMPGFIQYDELPNYYALAEAFVHASTSEQWGLVINEAMASGLPVLVSNRCGCVEDLIKPMVNGQIFDPLAVDDIAKKMGLISSVSVGLQEMGHQSQKIIAEYSPAAFAENLVSAAKKAVCAQTKTLGVLDRLLLNYLIRK